MQARARSTGIEEPRFSAIFPHSYQYFIWITWIGNHIGHARLIIHIKNFLPSFTAVFGSKNTSFRIWPEWRTLSTNINDIGIITMNDYPVYCFGIFQTQTLPCFSTIPASVNPFSHVLRIPWITLTRSNPDIERIFLI